MILVQFKPRDLGILSILDYLSCELGALFNGVFFIRFVVTPLSPEFIMMKLSSFKIPGFR